MILIPRILIVICTAASYFTVVNTEPSIYDDFMYKVITVGVAIYTDTISAIRGIGSQEHRLRETIYNALSADIDLGNSTDERVSNITIIPIEYETDFDNITDISFLVSIAGCEETWELNAQLTARYGVIAHIAITEPGCPRLDPETALTVPLIHFSKVDEVRQLIVDMRQAKVLPKWKSVVVIYDKVMGETTLNAVVDSLMPNEMFSELATSYFTVDSRNPSKSYERQMEEVFQNFQGKRGQFLVVTTLANMESTLSLAKRMGMLHFSTQWLFLSPDGILGSERSWNYVTDRIISDGVNVAFISNKTVGSGNFNQLLCSLQEVITQFTRTIEDLAIQEYNLYLQVSDEEWENRKVSREFRVTSILSNAALEIDGATQEACENSYRPSWKLEATENGRFGKRVFDVGNWFNFKGLKMTDDLFPHVVGGFRGRRLKITSFHYPPWQIFTINETTGATTYSGLIFEIVNQMGTVLNFTYEVIVPKDGATWGSEQYDGTWNGMMRLVIDQKVVLGAAAFANRPEKSRHVNFTMTLEREAYTFMVNRPSELSRVLLFAEPFRIEVWLCIAASLLLIAPTFYYIHRFSPYYDYNNKRTDRGLFKFKNCFLYVYGALLQQGGSLLPDAISGRMLIGFWWLFALVTVTTYSGNLVAFLTFPRIEAPVNSIRDIVNHKGVDSWGFIAGSVIERYLKESNDTDLLRLYRYAKKHPTINETVLNKIRDGNHAYIDWKISLMLIMKEQLFKTEKCEYMLGKEEIFEEQIAMIVPRTSPYLQMFNNEIKWMLQSGLVKMWKSDYWPKKDRCSSTLAVAAVNRTVKIGDMQGSFYLLMMGFFIALTVLLVEYIIYRRKQGKMLDQIKIFVTSNKAAEFATELWHQKKDLPFLH